MVGLFRNSGAIQRLQKLVQQFARRASGMGKEVADLAGSIDDVASSASKQARTLEELQGQAGELTRGNRAIGDAAAGAREAAHGARDEVDRALENTRVLASAVTRVETGITAVNGALVGVERAASDIAQVALQTGMVALNASAQAARAGGEAGRTFAVVASSIRELSEQVQKSSRQISLTVRELQTRVEALAAEARSAAGKGGDPAAAVEAAIATFRGAFGRVEEQILAIDRSAAANLELCTDVTGRVGALAEGVAHTSSSLDGARGRVKELVGLSESLLELTAEGGVATEDTPFIDLVVASAARISAIFEEALRTGAITEAALFDEHYEPIAGTNPQQHMSRFVQLTDSLLPAVQEPILAFSPLVTFCAAVDRNGYLPTHNRKYSHPQRRDAAWNAANCRNRRIFNDRTGLAAGKNHKPFLLQTYRRDMGNGQFVLMKDLSAPIVVRGRHWGGFRLGYRFA
jgi:methyl-accepting chemotaxis protein